MGMSRDLFKKTFSSGPAAEPTAPAAAASPAAAAPPAAGPAAQQLTPEMLARIAAVRSRLQLSVGQVVLAIMHLTRYRNQTLADLGHLVIEPLLRDRVAIAHRGVKDETGAAKADEDSIAGIAIWATVSDAVDAKITEQVKAGAFPVRLAAEDWTSGDHVWLLDVVAADRKQATSVLANFRQLAGERTVRIHPMVGRMIDPAVLEKIKSAAKT